mgnify:CR=1 FL=1
MKNTLLTCLLFALSASTIFAQEQLTTTSQERETLIQYSQTYPTDITKKFKRKSDLPPRSSISVGVGYGASLLGIEGSYRLTPRIGLSAGLGYRGFTAGVKYHFRTYSMSGAYVALTYRNGGFNTYNQSVGPIVGYVFGFGQKQRIGWMVQGGIHALTTKYSTSNDWLIKDVSTFITFSTGLTIKLGK